MTLSPTSLPTKSPTLKPTHKPSTSPFIDTNNYGIVIYAINGINDINIIYNGTFGPKHKGKIYCANMYENSCNLATNNWKCDSENHLCNNINNNIQSIPPTLTPTIFVIDEIVIENTIKKETEIIKTETNVPTVAILNIVKNNGNVNNNWGNNYITTGNKNGDFFILIGICIVLITCCAVGYAQIRKTIKDAKRLSEVYGGLLFFDELDGFGGLQPPPPSLSIPHSELKEFDENKDGFGGLQPPPPSLPMPHVEKGVMLNNWVVFWMTLNIFNVTLLLNKWMGLWVTLNVFNATLLFDKLMGL